MRFLFIGDIVGTPGVAAARKLVPHLRRTEGLDFVVANAENATNGSGCSPRDYLIACRLELARTRLLAGGEGHTVTRIALDCGFTDMAVFARKYRVHFGERPSETLRRR